MKMTFKGVQRTIILDLDTKDKACYNFRKRYGKDVAKIIINFLIKSSNVCTV